MSFPELGSYRISRTLSAKLRLVTLLAVTAVVFVHTYNLSNRYAVGENAAETSAEPGVVGFVEYLLSQTLVRRCLPVPYAWLTGGRGGRGGHRPAPSPEPAAGATDLAGEPTMAEAVAGSSGG